MKRLRVKPLGLLFVSMSLFPTSFAFAEGFIVYTSSRVQEYESWRHSNVRAKAAVNAFLSGYKSKAPDPQQRFKAQEVKRFFDMAPSSPAFVRWQHSTVR